MILCSNGHRKVITRSPYVQKAGTQVMNLIWGYQFLLNKLDVRIIKIEADKLLSILLVTQVLRNIYYLIYSIYCNVSQAMN